MIRMTPTKCNPSDSDMQFNPTQLHAAIFVTNFEAEKFHTSLRLVLFGGKFYIQRVSIK